MCSSINDSELNIKNYFPASVCSSEEKVNPCLPIFLQLSTDIQQLPTTGQHNKDTFTLQQESVKASMIPSTSSEIERMTW